MFETLTATIRNAVSHYPVILLSPRSRRRNALLADLVSKPDSYFYALSPVCNSIPTFLDGLVEALRQESPSFGQQVEQALDVRKLNLADAAEALADDLKRLKPSPRLFILSEVDFLPFDEDVSSFFAYLVQALPSDMHLVINARDLPLQPWASLVRSGQATVLGAPDIDSNIFDPSWPDKRHLEVFALGRGRAHLNGKPVQAWEGPLSRNLFFYLVDRPGALRKDIFETFWPDVARKEATNIFHVTKRKITDVIGSEITHFTSSDLGYKRNPKVIFHYDVDQFQAAVREGRQNNSLDAWQRAIRLHRGPFLSGQDMPWILERREQLRLDYVEALVAAGRLYKGMKEAERAIPIYLRALLEVPEREDIHRDLMTLYAQTGQKKKAVAQFHLLEKLLQKQHGIRPAPETVAAYAKVSGK